MLNRFYLGCVQFLINYHILVEEYAKICDKSVIDLITVLEAILTGIGNLIKKWYLYENLMLRKRYKLRYA